MSWHKEFWGLRGNNAVGWMRVWYFQVTDTTITCRLRRLVTRKSPSRFHLTTWRLATDDPGPPWAQFWSHRSQEWLILCYTCLLMRWLTPLHTPSLSSGPFSHKLSRDKLFPDGTKHCLGWELWSWSSWVWGRCYLCMRWLYMTI